MVHPVEKSRIMFFFKLEDKSGKVWYSIRKDELFQDSEEKLAIASFVGENGHTRILLNSDSRRVAAREYILRENLTLIVDEKMKLELENLFLEVNFDTKLRLGIPKAPELGHSRLWVLLVILGSIFLLLIVTIVVIIICVRRKRRHTREVSTGLYQDTSYSGLDLNNQETLTYLAPTLKK